MTFLGRLLIHHGNHRAGGPAAILSSLRARSCEFTRSIPAPIFTCLIFQQLYRRHSLDSRAEVIYHKQRANEPIGVFALRLLTYRVNLWPKKRAGKVVCVFRRRDGGIQRLVYRRSFPARERDTTSAESSRGLSIS